MLSKQQQDIWASKSDSIEHYWNIAMPRTLWFIKELQKYNFDSIFEVGCNSGRNLFHIENKIIGGIDICKAAIDFAKEKMPNGNFYTGAIQDMKIDKYDIVFSSGVLLHIPPDDIKQVIINMILKSNKYIMHMETNGDGSILNGPKELNPKNKIINKLRWIPNIVEVYKELGYNAIIKTIPCGERDAKHFIVVNI
jgi:SAM-dependent methyltransferase